MVSEEPQHGGLIDYNIWIGIFLCILIITALIILWGCTNG